MSQSLCVGAGDGARRDYPGSDISVLVNNYMERKLADPRSRRSHPAIAGGVMEMTRFGLGQLYEETGICILEVANRMVDYGIDPVVLVESRALGRAASVHTGSGRDVLERGHRQLDRGGEADCQRSARDARTGENRAALQAIAKMKDDALDDPDRWAMTWRAYLRKHRSPPKGFSQAAE